MKELCWCSWLRPMIRSRMRWARKASSDRLGSASPRWLRVLFWMKTWWPGGPSQQGGVVLVDQDLAAVGLALQPAGQRGQEVGGGRTVTGGPDDRVHFQDLRGLRRVVVLQGQLPRRRGRALGLHHVAIGVERDQIRRRRTEAVVVDALVDRAQRRLRDAVAGQHVVGGEPAAGRRLQAREVVGEAGHVVVVGERRVVDRQVVGAPGDPGDAAREPVVRTGDQVQERLGAGLPASDDRHPLARQALGARDEVGDVELALAEVLAGALGHPGLGADADDEVVGGHRAGVGADPEHRSNSTEVTVRPKAMLGFRAAAQAR